MNTFIESNKGKHFTLSDRISIEAGIEKGWSFKKIADELGKSPSSVSREVRRHLIFSPHYYDDFFFYRAKHSHDTSLELRSSSRSGINLSPKELDQLDRLVSPLIKKGQPLSHIFLSHMEDIPCCHVLFIPTWISNIFLLSTLIFPEKSATKNAKRNILIHQIRSCPPYSVLSELFPDASFSLAW